MSLGLTEIETFMTSEHFLYALTENNGDHAMAAPMGHDLQQKSMIEKGLYEL
jgi:hypothetical protein